jgi:myo-inositol-1(or 4)-monophosphatase
MKQNFSPTINIMQKAARKAARILIRDYGEICNLQSSPKSIISFINSASSKVEQSLIYELSAAKPNYGFVCENKNIKGDDQNYRWVINSLEGKLNFAHAIPFFAISIALEKLVGDDKFEIIASVIEVPILGETYWSEKGAGAWVDKHTESLGASSRLRVSTRFSLNDVIAATVNINEKSSNFVIKASNAKINFCINDSINLSLAYLAYGKYDLVINFDEYLTNKAGTLLVLEAGGRINTYNHEGINLHVASNTYIDKELEKIKLFG